MRLLIVEDEQEIADPLARGLRRQGYAVDIALDGDAGYYRLESGEHDLAVLDLNLPGMDGLEIVRRVRSAGCGIPILILTARDEDADRVAGLDCGADDYLAKPFSFNELSARVRALLRRERQVLQPLLRCGDLTLDPAARRLCRAGRPLELTRKEFGILEYLMRHPGKIVSQEALLDHVWDELANPFTNALSVHMSSLRRKLGEGAPDACYIRTAIGKGYQILPTGTSDQAV
ncbi:MAG: response regulator transcription factor [Chloroflexota bacterium]